MNFLRTKMMMFDVVVLVLAVGHLWRREWQVGDPGERIVERLVRLLRDGLEFGQPRLELGNLGHQHVSLAVVLRFFCGTNLPGCRVTPCQRLFGGNDRSAALLVE